MLARLKGLSSESLTFLWLMLHGLLPTRDRLYRILPTVTNATCQEQACDQLDSLKHALTECRNTRPVFDWMMRGLRKFNSSLTVAKLLLLDLEPDNVLAFGHLPLVWFTAEVLRRVWRRRRDGRQCSLFLIRAELEAEVNIVRHSWYEEMTVTLEQMMGD